MEITLMQGLGLALLAFIAGLDFYLEAFFWFRPIIVGTVSGMILGDLTLGVICGGITELAFAGLTPAGGTQPPNPILAGIMATVLAHTGGLGAKEAMALALPFSFLMQYVVIFFWSGYSLLMPRMDKYAREADTKKFYTVSIASWVLVGVVYAIVVFLSAYLAQDAMRNLISLMPEWLTHGFEIIGGILPGIGFAMLLKTMLKGWLVPYLVIGFLFATFIDFGNLLPLAILAAALAIMEFNKYNDQKKAGLAVGGDNSEGI